MQFDPIQAMTEASADALLTVCAVAYVLEKGQDGEMEDYALYAHRTLDAVVKRTTAEGPRPV